MTYDGPTGLFVDGEWTDAEGGETLTVEDPATEEAYGEVARAGAADVDRAVAAAKRAAARGSEWRELGPSERGRLLDAMADAVEARFDEIVTVESRQQGKTPFEARIDVRMAVDTVRYFAGWADKIEGETIPVPGERLDYTLREPLGVTGHITPWNYPFQLSGRSLAPALACGNTAVLKPAAETPLSSLYFALAAEEAGLPPGVLNVVPGTGPDAGARLAAHEDVAHVAFTGSTEVGREIGRTTGERVAGATLELGGKGANVVFPDADLDAAAKGVRNGIFTNAGQMCWAGSRLLVHGEIHDELVERVVELAESMPLGSGIDDDARMGPLASADQRDTVLSYIETGREEGATVACGGGAPADRDRGHFVEPTVLTGVDDDATVAREEIFGPVLAVIPFGSTAEAVEIANDSPYGLYAGLWTTDLSTAHTVADRLEYGMVSVNEYPVTFPQTPFGGVKASGHGREQGREAVREYTRVKNVTVNLG